MKVIEEGQPWPQSRLAIAQRLFGVVAGYSSKNFVEVEYYPTAIPVERAGIWPKFDGDPSIWQLGNFWIPRLAKRAGIVAVRSETMDALAVENPGSQPAVLTESLGGMIWGGLLPEGCAFGRIELDGVEYEAIAGRLGKRPLHIMPARIDPADSHIVWPPSMEAVRQVGPVRFNPALPSEYASVPVV